MVRLKYGGSRVLKHSLEVDIFGVSLISSAYFGNIFMKISQE